MREAAFYMFVFGGGIVAIMFMSLDLWLYRGSATPLADGMILVFILLMVGVGCVIFVIARWKKVRERRYLNTVATKGFSMIRNMALFEKAVIPMFFSAIFWGMEYIDRIPLLSRFQELEMFPPTWSFWIFTFGISIGIVSEMILIQQIDLLNKEVPPPVFVDMNEMVSLVTREFQNMIGIHGGKIVEVHWKKIKRAESGGLELEGLYHYVTYTSGNLNSLAQSIRTGRNYSVLIVVNRWAEIEYYKTSSVSGG
jgi:hypothetical protein